MLLESAFQQVFCLKYSFKLVTFYVRKQKWVFFSEHSVAPCDLRRVSLSLSLSLSVIGFTLKGSPKQGLGVNLGVGAKIFCGKVHLSSELRVFRHLWYRSDAACSSILYGYSHLPQVKIWASLGVPSSPTRSHRQSPLPSRKAPLWTFNYHMETSQSFCDVTSVTDWSPEGTFQAFCIGKQGKILKLGTFDALQLCNRTSYKNVEPTAETPWPLDYNGD